MHVRQIDLDRRQDVRRFVNFPFELYRDCPQWVPPLRRSVYHALDPRRHPFYQHSTAAFFIAEDKKTLGRLAVMDNRRYNDHCGLKTAFFGYWDVVDDAAVNRALFDAAFEWARARGLNRIIGPRGLVGLDSIGVLVEGFEHRPAMGVNYNYPYYDALLQQVGFEKETDHLSGHLGGTHRLSERFYKIADWVKSRRGFTIKTFSSVEEMRRWVPQVTETLRQSFRANHTYYPPTDAEMQLMTDDLIAIADPRLIKLVLKGEEVVGFLIAHHDLSAGLQKSRGYLWPLGWYYLLRERKRTRWANVSAVGLLEEYRGQGANVLLYTEIEKSLVEFGFEHADIVRVDEKNIKSFSDMEAIGVAWYKRHRHYQRALSTDPSAGRP